MSIKKKIGLVVLAVIALSTALGLIAEKHDKAVLGPAQNVKFINGSQEERIVYFYSEIPDEKGEMPSGYFYKFQVPPGETLFGKVHQGRYSYEIWGNSDETLLGEYKNLSILEDSTENNPFSLYISLSPDSYTALLGINYLYGGNSLTESLSAAAGADRSRPYIEKLYRGGKPFKLPAIVYERDHVVDYGEKAPEEIGYAKLVYALVPVPGSVQYESEALESAAAYAEENL